MTMRADGVVIMGGVAANPEPGSIPGPAANRVRLPNRRPSITETLYWPIDQGAAQALGALGRKVFLTVGFDMSSGRALECFLRGGSKHGEQIDFALDELARDISLRLQHGGSLLQLLSIVHINDLADHLVPRGERSAQRFGAVVMVDAVVHRMVQLECDHGPALVAARGRAA